MKYLFVVRQGPRQLKSHNFLINLLARLVNEHEILAVFFTSEAVQVALATRENEIHSLTQAYLNLHQSNALNLLCCSQALHRLDLDPKQVLAGFEVSGIMELSVLSTQADRMIEF